MIYFRVITLSFSQNSSEQQFNKVGIYVQGNLTIKSVFIPRDSMTIEKYAYVTAADGLNYFDVESLGSTP